MVYDWNHLSLSVAVTAEPTLKHGHGLKSQKKPFEYDNQNATKITSALAHTSIQFSSPVTPTLVKTLCAYLFLVTIFLTVCHRPLSPSVVTMLLSSSTDIWRDRWTKNADQCSEDYYYDSLVFCWHHIDLVFDEDNMEPARLEEAPKKAGIDQILWEWTCGIWNQPLRVTTLSCYQNVAWAKLLLEQRGHHVRYEGLLKKDEERLAMQKGDVPPTLPKRMDNTRMREDQALLEFYSKSDKIHRVTFQDAYV